MLSTDTPLILLVQHGNNHWRYTLNTPAIQIGRGSHNDITLFDAAIAIDEARLIAVGAAWFVEPLDNASHITLNQQPVIQRTALHVNDILQIGSATLRLTPQPDDAEALRETVLDPNAPTRAETAFAIDVNVPDTNRARLAIQLVGKIWEVPLKSGPNTIGRAADNDIRIDHPKVSRQHATVELRDGIATLVDQRSGNGTWVDGEKISEKKIQGSEAIQIGPAVLVYKPAFVPNDLNAPAKRGLPGQRQRKPIVFIPGFMGSQLWRGETLIWPDLKLLLTHPELLMLPEEPTNPITVKGLVEDVVVVPGLYKLEQYSLFTQFLKESLGYSTDADLLEFAYDWRKDLRLAAQQLKAQVEAFRQTLPDPTTKVILIAHSMGCLVTRYFLEVLGGDQMAERVILMGGPHLGTPKIVLALLTGKGLLPLNLINDKIRDAVATFPGAYQLLPIYPAVFGPGEQAIDIFADTRWVQAPYRSYVEDARKFRNELSQKARIPTLCILGYGNKTVVKAQVTVDEAGGWQNINFVEDPDGDATIPVSSAILEGADFHPVQQSHGALFVDNDVKFRLKLELMK